MDDIPVVGSFGEKTSTVYICTCGTHLFMVEALEHPESGVSYHLRCWGCHKRHPYMQVEDMYEEEEE